MMVNWRRHCEADFGIDGTGIGNPATLAGWAGTASCDSESLAWWWKPARMMVSARRYWEEP